MCKTLLKLTAKHHCQYPLRIKATLWWDLPYMAENIQGSLKGKSFLTIQATVSLSFHVPLHWIKSLSESIRRRGSNIDTSGLWIYLLYGQIESQRGQGLPWPRFLVVFFSALGQKLGKHLSNTRW